MLLSSSDEQLVKGCLSGDRRSAERLFERHQPYVYRICRGMLGRPEDAEDATQDAFVRALGHLGGFRGGSSFRTWLHRVTVTTCLDQIRRRRETVSLDDLGEIRESASSRPELKLEVNEALDALEPGDKAVLLLREVEGLSYVEIAEAMECSVEAIRSRLYRARQNFRKVFSP